MKQKNFIHKLKNIHDLIRHFTDYKPNVIAGLVFLSQIIIMSVQSFIPLVQGIAKH